MTKKVLCLCPSTFGYERRTRDAVEAAGYDAVWMDERVGNSFFAKFVTRMGWIRRMPWLLNAHVDRIIERIRADGIDTVLLLDPETITGKELAAFKAAVPGLEIIVYTWDGFNQKPINAQAFEVADAVYSFDIVDCERNPGLVHIPLFHNHKEPPSFGDPGPKEYDFSHVGTARFRRIRALAAIEKLLYEQDRPHFFYLVANSAIQHAVFSIGKWYYGYRGTISRTPLAYPDYLDVVAKSRCVVDIEFSSQSGLTMRTFEVVFAGTPLLTTNPMIERYDFYPESTIFVFDETAPDLPPTEALAPKDNSALYEKYSILNWARTVMTRSPQQYLRDPAHNAAVGDTTGETA